MLFLNLSCFCQIAMVIMSQTGCTKIVAIRACMSQHVHAYTKLQPRLNSEECVCVYAHGWTVQGHLATCTCTFT